MSLSTSPGDSMPLARGNSDLREKGPVGDVPLGKLEHVRVFSRSLSEIRPSSENDNLYRPVTSDDPEVQSLAESIRKHGLMEPIVVTEDGYILSGHRRYVAAGLAGLTEVPCRTYPISRRKRKDEFLRLLREFNRQRSKTNAERLREEIVSIDAGEAYGDLIDYRMEKSELKLQTMEIEGEVRRHQISPAKRPFLEAIKRVIDDRREFWPLSDRQIHYALLNDPPLMHAGKPNSTYRNDKRSYRQLVELATRARLDFEIPMQAIADETRPVCQWETHPETGPFVADQVKHLMRGYCRDLLQSQPNQIEILGEKNTVASILKPVASKYGIPFTTGRGYCSLPPRAAMAERFKKSGREKLVLLIISDFDPDGEEIAQAFARSMRDDFYIGDVEAIKVALTEEQVRKYGLVPNMSAKSGSANFTKFTRRFGKDVFELEALDPSQLQDILDEAIRSVIDVDAFNLEVKREKEDAVFLEGVRRSITESLRGISCPGSEAVL